MTSEPRSDDARNLMFNRRQVHTFLMALLNNEYEYYKGKMFGRNALCHVMYACVFCIDLLIKSSANYLCMNREYIAKRFALT